jgi:hypothetical protein
LPLAEVSKSAVLGPFVGVSMAAASRTCEREYERMTCGRAYSTLHLPTKFRVNISAAVVSASYLKIINWNASTPHT